MVLAAGRPGVSFWVSPDGDGDSWISYDVLAEHNRRAKSHLRYPCASNAGCGLNFSTGYTSLVEVELGNGDSVILHSH